MYVSRPSTDEEGLSKNNAILNIGFLFGFMNGLIDDKFYGVSQLISDGPYSSFSRRGQLQRDKGIEERSTSKI
jgi:hypothetical protein